MKVADFINTGFREYVNYDNDRSLPHLMDGLKITQRKVLYAFIEDIGHQTIVCDKAGMRAADLTRYKHGAVSMIDVLIKMNQDFPGANTLPLFDKEGQFGTRLNHEASSERYISTKLNDTFKKLFDPDDNHILREQFVDGDRIEPEYYLPKLPLLLINGANGTGNGYKSVVLSYDVADVKKAVIECLKTGFVQTKLTPYIKGFEGEIEKDHETGQVTFTGNIRVHNSNTLIIDELPPGKQLDAYKSVLNKLREEELIKDYDNESNEDAWRFVIDCPRTTTALTREQLLAKFKLIEKETEVLVAWLPNGKLKRFSSVEAMIEEWVRYRLEFYEERRLNKIDRYNAELDWLKVKMKFIGYWNESAIDLVRMRKPELKDLLKKVVTTNDDFIDRLLSIRISNLGIEEVEELQKEIDKIEGQVEAMQGTNKSLMMSQDIKEIKL